MLQTNRDKVQSTTMAPEKGKQQNTAVFFDECTLNTWRWPIMAETCSEKTFSFYFILNLTNSNKLRYTRDCVLKEILSNV
jgi:hypothetical protein